MKKHTKIYCDYFGIGEQDYVSCEWCGCRRAVDIHHIEPKKRGGSKDKDYIENLMGLCRECHIEAEAKRISKEELTKVHLKRVKQKSL